MTDDREQGWRGFGEEPEWDRPESAEEAAAGRSRASAEEAAKPLSQFLRRHTRAVDRSMEQIDDVVAELRHIATRPADQTPTTLGDGMPFLGLEPPPSIGPMPLETPSHPREAHFAPPGKAPFVPPLDTPPVPAADTVSKLDAIRPAPPIVEALRPTALPTERSARKPQPEAFKRHAPVTPPKGEHKPPQDQPSARAGEPDTREMLSRPVLPGVTIAERTQPAGQSQAGPAARKPEPEISKQDAPATPPKGEQKPPQDQPRARAGEPDTREMTSKPVLPGVTIAEPTQPIGQPQAGPARKPEPEMFKRHAPATPPKGEQKPQEDQSSTRAREPDTQEMTSKPVLPGVTIAERTQPAGQSQAGPAARKPEPEILEQHAPATPPKGEQKPPQDQPSARAGEPDTQEMTSKPVLPGVTIAERTQPAGQPQASPAARKPEPEISIQPAPVTPPKGEQKPPQDQPSARAGEPDTREMASKPVLPGVTIAERTQPTGQPQASPAARKPEPEILIQPAPVTPPKGEQKPQPDQPSARVGEPNTQEMKNRPGLPGVTIEGDRGPVLAREQLPGGGGPTGTDKGRGGGGGGGGGGGVFHKRLGPIDFSASLAAGMRAVKQNLIAVMIFTIATNVLVLAIPVYLFQISDRVLTSRSIDTLVMLTVVIVGAVILQAVFDAIRRFILMRTAVEVAAQLGGPILSAAARASLHSNGREYQTLGDLQQLRTFLVSGTLLALLDAPMAPLFVLAIFLIHPDLGFIVVATALVLLAITLANQRATAKPFSEATAHQTKANLHVESMSRNSQIINALAMIPEAVWMWGKDTGNSLRSQVIAQDRNIAFASLSKGVRMLTQVVMLGWGAYLAIEGTVTGGMVIAASIIAGRALGPIEGAIEGWNQVVHSRAAYGRISALLKKSPLNFERLKLPRPEGRLDVERLLFVPQGTKRVVLNGVAFGLEVGDSLAIIGNSGAGKTTLGKMLVGSILPTSGSVRLDLMDLRNWDQRQFGENIGYLPQDVQLFPGSIKANIARMREDAEDGAIYEAAKLADVHDLIASLPHGYETFVAADGAPLSGGQKQRIALARAFFGSPRMVVLDEPNSNLDTAGELALSRALQQAKEQKITMVTITQRPALLQTVDKILVLVNGTVALFGMRQDVLQALSARGMSLDGGQFGNIQIK